MEDKDDEEYLKENRTPSELKMHRILRTESPSPFKQAYPKEADRSPESNNSDNYYGFTLEQRSRQKISETRRAAHLESEKKRRLNINQGFEDLRKLVPDCKFEDSKAEILRKSVNHILRMQAVIGIREIEKDDDDGDGYGYDLSKPSQQKIPESILAFFQKGKNPPPGTNNKLGRDSKEEETRDFSNSTRVSSNTKRHSFSDPESSSSGKENGEEDPFTMEEEMIAKSLAMMRDYKLKSGRHANSQKL